LLIINTITHDRGWSPIQHMVAIAGELFDWEVVAAEPRGFSKTTKGLSVQKLMMNAYGVAKFTLAFSNAVDRDPNNHPTREYLTGRWVDALGSGSTVAGVAPRGPNTDGLLLTGATLELGSVRPSEGLRVVAAALKQWTPDIAAANYQMALRRLDWRWRFEALAEVYGIRSAPLTLELQLLEERIAGLAATQILS